MLANQLELVTKPFSISRKNREGARERFPSLWPILFLVVMMLAFEEVFLVMCPEELPAFSSRKTTDSVL
jgi:hypothetical protein